MLYRLADRPDCTLEEVACPAEGGSRAAGAGVDSLVSAGMVERTDWIRAAATWCSPPPGTTAIDRLTAARRDSMTELLEGWDPEAHPEVVEMVRHLAKALLADDDKLLADARAAAV